jgi:protocatechuate 3,4-dioxygenase beta subunit
MHENSELQTANHDRLRTANCEPQTADRERPRTANCELQTAHGCGTQRQLSRRQIIGALSAVGAAALAEACGSSTPTTPTAGTTTTTTTTGGGTTSGTCAVINSETEGPYPDRTGMINNAAFYRQDITEGKPGTPLTLALTVVNVANGCAPVANATIEVWQCDAAGAYSEYNAVGTFLRGLQTTDANGKATFNTIYPGWYSGRATHIHLEVFVNGASVKTTQMAFPEDVTAAVYAQGVYASRGQNSTRNSTDNVFSDGTTNELATMSGSPSSGYTATLQIGI